MSEQDFQSKLHEIVSHAGPMSVEERERLQQFASEARERHTKLRQTVRSLQDALDQLRLSVKYLCFDLEATRRENQHLRSMLDEQRD